MKKTGPNETKVGDDGGPNRAKLKEIWNKIFHDVEHCKFYFDGLCVLKIMEQSELQQKDNPSNYLCEMCSQFEKGENPTKELRILRRLSKSVSKTLQRKSEEEV